MDSTHLEKIVDRFAGKRILVIGDVMLDEFIWGRVSRISPEAPVPVVEVSGESNYPGGAANVARNLKEFAGDVAVMGLIGQDPAGEALRRLLMDSGIRVDWLLQDLGCRTIVKTRIIARQQQVVRVDREKRLAMTAAQIARSLDNLERNLGGIDAVILADYGKGFLPQELVDGIC